MKVLHLAPLWFPVAADSLGGIETLLAALLPALEEQGCENWLIAPGDSRTPARLLPAVETNLFRQMEDGIAAEYTYYEQHQLLMAIDEATGFDVIHSHIGPSGYVLSGLPQVGDRVLHTQHNPVYEDQEWFIHKHPDFWYSTVSEFQAGTFRCQGATRCAVIPNGIDFESMTYRAKPDRGLFFIGRIEAAKGPDLAVKVARELDLPLTLAGPITDDAFFEKEIKPHLDERVLYVGQVDHQQKNGLFGAAACTLVPSRWDEPFGLVAIESMACGTPVVALARGGLTDVVDPGVTGYLADEEKDLAVLVGQASRLPRPSVRERAERRFDISIVARRYRDLYEQIAQTADEACAKEVNR